MIPQSHFLALGAVLFCISVAGIFINRKNVIVLLMSIELMLLEMLALIGVRRMTGRLAPPDTALAEGLSNTEWLGRALFRDYLLPFEVAGMILTVAIIAAIALTLRRRPNVRRQDPARQVLARKADRLRVVKMPPAGKEAQP